MAIAVGPTSGQVWVTTKPDVLRLASPVCRPLSCLWRRTAAIVDCRAQATCDDRQRHLTHLGTAQASSRAASFRSGERRQLRAVMHGAMPVIVEGEVEPLPVLAHEAVRVVHPAPRSVAALLLEDALVRPGLHAVEADPEGHRAAVLAVRVVQKRDRVASQ